MSTTLSSYGFFVGNVRAFERANNFANDNPSTTQEKTGSLLGTPTNALWYSPTDSTWYAPRQSGSPLCGETGIPYSSLSFVTSLFEEISLLKLFKIPKPPLIWR